MVISSIAYCVVISSIAYYWCVSLLCIGISKGQMKLCVLMHVQYNNGNITSFVRVHAHTLRMNVGAIYSHA